MIRTCTHSRIPKIQGSSRFHSKRIPKNQIDPFDFLLEIKDGESARQILYEKKMIHFELVPQVFTSNFKPIPEFDGKFMNFSSHLSEVQKKRSTGFPFGTEEKVHRILLELNIHPEKYGMLYVRDVWFVAHNFPFAVARLSNNNTQSLVIHVDKSSTNFVSESHYYIGILLCVFVVIFCLF